VGEVDARSDIFSFGVVLYEMLARHLPFRGEREAAMMYSILNEEPQLSQYTSHCNGINPRILRIPFLQTSHIDVRYGAA